MGKPQVAYRETIRKAVEKHEYTHKKQTGGSGQFAKVIIRAGAPRGRRRWCDLRIRQRRHRWSSREYIPSVDAGAQDAMQYGVLAGYPLVNVEGHPARRSVPRRRLVGNGVQDRRRTGLKEARAWLTRSSWSRSWPLGHHPEDYMGDVIGDLNSRRGQIQAMEERSGARVVKAQVPLSEMFGYIGDLRSKTQGRANYSMVFDSYAEVPANVSKEIIAKATGE